MHNLDSVLRHLGLVLKKQERIALKIGLIAQYHETIHPADSVDTYIAAIGPAVLLEQCDIYFDSATRVVGYVTWALVSDSMSETLRRRGRNCLAANEWRSGGNLWIIDFCASKGWLQPMLNALRDETLPASERVSYFRYRRNGWNVKTVYRRANCSVLRRLKPAGVSPTAGRITENLKILHQRKCSFMHSIAVAQCLLLSATSPQYKDTKLISMRRQLAHLCALRQVKIYRNEQGNLLGLVSWLWLSEYSIASGMGCQLEKMHISEYNEGDVLCFWMIVSLPEGRSTIQSGLSDGRFRVNSFLWLQSADNGCPAMTREYSSREWPEFALAATGHLQDSIGLETFTQSRVS